MTRIYYEAEADEYTDGTTWVVFKVTVPEEGHKAVPVQREYKRYYDGLTNRLARELANALSDAEGHQVK